MGGGAGKAKEAKAADAGGGGAAPNVAGADAKAGKSPKGGGDDAGQASQKLPLQLKRLPTKSLRTVSTALAVLKENGLTDQINVEQLLAIVEKSLEGADIDVSEYMGMCAWARTRRSWADAVGDADPSKNCQLAAKSADEWAKEINKLADELEKLRQGATQGKWRQPEGEGWLWRKPEAIMATLEKKEWHKRLKGEVDDEGNVTTPSKPGFFEAWWASQLAADQDLRRCADESFKPKMLGVGKSVFFEVLKTATPPPPAPKKKLTARGEEPPKIGAGTCGFAGVLTVHIGSAGLDMGAAMWKRIVAEHKIGSDGKQEAGAFGCCQPHFEESATGRMMPRAVLAWDGACERPAAGVFDPSDLVTAEGFTAQSAWQYKDREDDQVSLIYDATMERIRLQMERMDKASGIILTNAFGGDACGAGLGTSILEYVSSNFGKLPKCSVSLVPGLSSDYSEGPVVNIFSQFDTFMEHSDLKIFVDQEGLSKNGGADSGYAAVGGLLSTLTAPVRIGNCVSASDGTRRQLLNGLFTNLCPYPRISSVLASYAPLKTGGEMKAEELIGQGMKKGLLAGGDFLSEGKYIAQAVMCRGPIGPSAIWNQMTKFKENKDNQFVDFAPTGILASFHADPSCKDGEVMSLINHTGFGKLFNHWASKFDERRDEYIQAAEKFIDDGAENVMNSAREDIQSYIKDYEEVGIATAE